MTPRKTTRCMGLFALVVLTSCGGTPSTRATTAATLDLARAGGGRRANERALAEARAARAHLASGRGWRSLLLLLRDGTLVPEASLAPEADEGEDVDEEESEDEEALEPVEREVPRSDPADTDPVAIAARAEPGSAPRVLAEPIEVSGSFAVIERLAVFTPPDRCGL